MQARELKSVNIDGTQFYVDERLCQIRSVDDPHTLRNFTDEDEMWDYINEANDEYEDVG